MVIIDLRMRFIRGSAVGGPVEPTRSRDAHCTFRDYYYFIVAAHHPPQLITMSSGDHGRSLRGSTNMIRRATDRALSQAAELRAHRDVDAPPEIRRETQWRNDDAPSTSKKRRREEKGRCRSHALFSREIESAVRSAYDDVKARRSVAREALVRSALDENNAAIARGIERIGRSHHRSAGSYSPPPSSEEGKSITSAGAAANQIANERLVFPRLPSNRSNVHSHFALLPSPSQTTEPTNLSSSKNHALSIITHKNATTTTTTRQNHHPLLLLGAHPPRPSSASVLFLKSHFAASDERELSHVPYFGEDYDTNENDNFDWDLFDVRERMRLYEYGPGYAEEETMGTIDGVLRMLRERELGWFEGRDAAGEDGGSGDEDGGTRDATDTMRLVHKFLAELSGVNVGRVQERHMVCFGPKEKTAKMETIAEQHPPSSPSRAHKKNNSAKEDPSSYEEAIDSYRDLFCRQCFTYDCNLHGNLPKADLRLLGELALLKEREGHWKEVRVKTFYGLFRVILFPIQ